MAFPMTPIDWIVSLAALAWLIALAAYDLRRRQLPGLPWLVIPFALAALYRAASFHAYQVAAASVIVLALSERKHLESRFVSAMAIFGALLLFLWFAASGSDTARLGLGGVCVFWILWEMHWIGGNVALTLLAGIMVWPGIAFSYAVMIAAAPWFLAERIRRRARKGFVVSGPVVVATAAVIFLIDFVFLHILSFNLS